MLGELSLQGPAKLLLNDEEQPMGHGSSLASAGIFYRRTFGGGDRRFGQHRVGMDNGRAILNYISLKFILEIQSSY
jgi:hypothetical protein